ncbi:MAG: FAD-dependent oxidoreductase [Synergistaceae bacterium]|nr:FAD-dependent oxidoreductase [Synergistaceae bacterium]
MALSVHTVDAVVVGGGIMGCATAYYLRRAGVSRVAVIERDSLCSGSTGRCAGGFRQQFPTVDECRLAKDSIGMIETLTDELGYDMEVRQGGYLVLSYTEEHAKDAKEKIAMQNGIGIPVRWMEVPEIESFAPWLNSDEGFVGAAFCPTDGTLNPFKMTYAYAKKFQNLGGEIYQHTEVKEIKALPGGGFKTVTTEGEFSSPLLFNCAGAYSAKIGDMLGHAIPIVPLAREKIITEPVKYFQPFLCNSPLHTLHFNQTEHGSFLMSCANMSIKQRGDLRNTWRFTQETADAVARLLPVLKKVRILRQWAGYYETTPDGKPFIGGIEGIKGFYQSAGYNGHGLMLAPAATKAIVDEALGNAVPQWYSAFNMARVEKKAN